MQIDSSSNDAGPRLITPASVPKDPVRPTPVRDALLALTIGLLLGVGLALLFEQLDDSIKGREDLERSTGNLPVLAMIPSVPGWRDRGESRVVALSDPGSPTAEAYRTLRTSIRFLAVDNPLRVIQITSPTASEGKTTLTANLGVVLARAGERVVLVSCDLRRPRLHQFFGLSNEWGFTSVLLGERSLRSALQPVAGEGLVNGLSLLSSGPVPPNPSELLSSGRATQLLDEIAASADVVLVDCPPVLPVTDAAVLSRKVDGSLLVVNAGSGSGKRVSRAVETLHQVGAPLVGCVLNGAPLEGGSYKYSYSGSYSGGRGGDDSAVAGSRGDDRAVERLERRADVRGRP